MYEGVALFATPKEGSTTVSNQYFVDLKAGNGNFDASEMALLEGELGAIVDEYIADNDLFLEEYTSGWNYMMTADRFKGPRANACKGVKTPTIEGETAATAAPDVSGGTGTSTNGGTETSTNGSSAATISNKAAVLASALLGVVVLGNF